MNVFKYFFQILLFVTNREHLIIFFILISLNMKLVGKKYTETISNFIEKTYNILEN